MTVNAILAVIEKERVRSGRSVAWLCATAGIHLDSYSRWLRGVNTPRLDKVINAARALGLSLVIEVKKTDEC